MTNEDRETKIHTITMGLIGKAIDELVEHANIHQAHKWGIEMESLSMLNDRPGDCREIVLATTRASRLFRDVVREKNAQVQPVINNLNYEIV